MSRLAIAGGVLAALIPASAALADDAGTQVEEIVVTGEKAQRSLQETVASVAVVTARRLEEENIEDFFDVVARTANMSETYGPSGFSIRGITNTGVTGGGTGGLATVYVDGAAIPDQAVSNGPLNMWDIQQVEVLRGPQSTLQGRNTLAGAVVIRTKDPTWTWTAVGRALVSDQQETTVSLAGGGPIVADQLAFRIAYENRDADGFIYNATRKEQEDPVDASTVRGTLLFTPTTLPGLTVRASVTHDERKGGYIFSYARTDVPDPFEERVALGDSPTLSDTTTDIFVVSADYDISDRLTLSAVTAWNKVDNFSSYDQDSGPTPISYGTQDEVTKTFSQEARLTYAGERLNGLVGVYYSKRDRDYLLKSLSNVETPRSTLVALMTSPLFGLDSATANFAANAYVAALPVIPVDFVGDSPDQIETAALFADGRFQLTPQLSILAGFRYDHEENTLAVAQTAKFAGTLPNPAAYGALAPVIGGLNQVVLTFVSQASASQPADTRTFDAFLPKLGVKYDLTDDAAVSFVAQRGYRSGGSMINIARSTIVPFDPEFTWNYELAVRTAWLDDSLTLNANAYYIDWTDQQVTVLLGLNTFDYQTVNAGASHLYGAEFEANYAPSRTWDVYGSLGYSKTEFDDFNVSVGTITADLTGAEFMFAPHWTFAVGGNYRWDNGLRLNLNANYRGDMFAGTYVGQEAETIAARTLVNGAFGYETERWSLSAFVNNIFDEEYVTYDQPAQNRAILGAPRVVGAILEARW